MTTVTVAEEDHDYVYRPTETVPDISRSIFGPVQQVRCIFFMYLTYRGCRCMLIIALIKKTVCDCRGRLIYVYKYFRIFQHRSIIVQSLDDFILFLM